MADYLDELELSVKTSNLLKLREVNENAFLRMTKEQWRRHGGLIRGWKEIEETQLVLIEIRKKRRSESTIGRACLAVKELNELRGDLQREGLFITKDNEGRFRVGRYITRLELKDAGDHHD